MNRLGTAGVRPGWLLAELPLHLRVGRELVRGIGRFMQTHERWQVLLAEEARAVVDRGEPLVGAVMLPAWNNPASAAFCERVMAMDLPQVWIGAVRSHPDRVVLQADNHAVGRLAAEHLLGLGLRRLAFYGNERPVFSQHRRAGFDARAGEAGVEVLKVPVEGDAIRHVEQSVEPELIRWLQRCERPIGLFADNDIAAVRLHLACRLAGLEVPEDAAILGVDNDETRCAATLPTLSSIDTGFDRLGFHAAELIERMRTGEQVRPQVIRFPPIGVVQRGSTDLLAVEDEHVRLALRFVRQRACDANLSIDEVAEAASAARRSLERRFKRAMGRTVHQEISRLRMERARRLLAETDEPIQAIASTCGYESLDNFYRTFRRHLEATPGGYRRASRLGGRPPHSEADAAG